VEAARIVVACELVTAVRAARHAVNATPGVGLKAVLEACRELSAATEDRVLVDDIQIAQSVLDSLVQFFDARF
jgi:histidine ammonia-lyase